MGDGSRSSIDHYERHVKQGIETGRFRAVHPLMQPLHMLICDTKITHRTLYLSTDVPTYESGRIKRKKTQS